MDRSSLKSIYDKLTNDEKWNWSNQCGYTSYQGLYRYLKGTGEAYEKIVNGLISTIGTDRFNRFIQSSKNELKNTNKTIQLVLDDINKNELIKIILNSNDTENIQKLKRDLQDIVLACDNQLYRLKIQSEF